MIDSERPPCYRAYVLRFWEVRGQQEAGLPAWRFSLEDPHTGTRRGFSSLESLVAFLQAETGPACTQAESVADISDNHSRLMG